MTEKGRSTKILRFNEHLSSMLNSSNLLRKTFHRFKKRIQPIKNENFNDTAKRQFCQVRIIWGRAVSTVSISLLKRFTTRPTGVVSKKLVGAWRIFVSKDKCRTAVACSVPSAILNDESNVVAAV